MMKLVKDQNKPIISNEVSDEEAKRIRDDIQIEIQELIDYEGEVMSDLEDPNICFLQVELSKL